MKRKANANNPTAKPSVNIPKERSFAAPVAVEVGAVPEGKVVDFLTGKFVKDTPEEYVRQNIEKALVRQYRYLPAQCQPEWRIKMGSAKPRVDIVIFPQDEKHEQTQAYILVETKKPGTSPQDKKEGIGQVVRLWDNFREAQALEESASAKVDKMLLH